MPRPCSPLCVESLDTILTGLQAMNDAAVSEFASDWRKAYPEPSPAKLSELRDIEQRIKRPPYCPPGL